MMRVLIITFVVITTSIIGITLFLTPNNLMKCGESPSDIQGCQTADAIVAISGGDTSARTQEAIDLYQRGWAPKIIFSGAAADKSGPSNAEVMRNQAINQGVPRGDIIIEVLSETTRENAEQTKSIFETRGVRSAILVTSSYHQKRSVLEFSRRVPDVEFRSRPSSSDNQWSVWWWKTPHGWYLAVSEVVKIIIFYLGGTR